MRHARGDHGARALGGVLALEDARADEHGLRAKLPAGSRPPRVSFWLRAAAAADMGASHRDGRATDPENHRHQQQLQLIIFVF